MAKVEQPLALQVLGTAAHHDHDHDHVDQPSKVQTVKVLAESLHLKSIPLNYVHSTTPLDTEAEPPASASIPIVDFSLLTSVDPDQRSKAIQELGRACRDWGFFMVVNHGVPDSLLDAIIEGCNEFFNLGEEEKLEFEGKHVLDPIRCGTSFNTSKEKAFFWRDFLKVFVHPEFHFPNKPAGFREVASEYCKRTRQLARELLRGISESLGLEQCYVEKTLNLDSSVQMFVANLYPPCPQHELAMGMPPHSDHGLLTLLIQNGVNGLQIQHKGKWFNVNAIPYSFLVNTGDHLEILSNNKYKSVVHRVIVNNEAKRLSLAMANGPSFETVVKPVPDDQFMDDPKKNLPKYNPITYREFLELQQSNKLHAKSVLDTIRIS